MHRWILRGLVSLLLGACAVPATPTLEPATAIPEVTVTPMAPVVPSATPPIASPTPSLTPTSIAVPTAVPSPTLPAVPPGMTVTAIDPPRYAVRLSAPGLKVRREPEAQSAVVDTLECGAAPVSVDAVAEGAEARWYHLGTGGWVRSDVVEVYTDEAAAQSAAATAECAAAGSGGAGEKSSEGDYVLAAAAVWNLGESAPPDDRSGDCQGESNYLPPYGPALFTYDGHTLTVQTQEPGSAYVFTRIAPNVYSYSGPTAAGDGRVTLTIKFTSATTASLTRVFVPDADPACYHTYYYSVKHMWDR